MAEFEDKGLNPDGKVGVDHNHTNAEMGEGSPSRSEMEDAAYLLQAKQDGVTEAVGPVRVLRTEDGTVVTCFQTEPEVELSFEDAPQFPGSQLHAQGGENRTSEPQEPGTEEVFTDAGEAVALTMRFPVGKTEAVTRSGAEELREMFGDHDADVQVAQKEDSVPSTLKLTSEGATRLFAKNRAAAA